MNVTPHGLALMAIFLGTHACLAQGDAAASATASLALWKDARPPFYFRYDGKDSTAFLSAWQKTEEAATPSEGGETHHYLYTDPATKLTVVADVRTFTDFGAIEWVLRFSNGGTADTPILENIQPLDWTVACDSLDVILHCARGSNQSLPDFEPQDTKLPRGASAMIGSDRGRSSEGSSSTSNTGGFPFFNLQLGDHGILGAIGWTGSWLAHFDRDSTGKMIGVRAGFLKTHLVLHPGETIRTARILLLNWRGGDVAESQNVWRRLMLAHYSPKDDDGHPLLSPVCFCSGGDEPISSKLVTIRFIHDQKIPADLYWIDAGWYGADPRLHWTKQRGSWSPNAKLYPNGLRPIGDLLKQYKIGFLLWIEAETASEGSTLLTHHPDWYLRPAGPMTEDQPAFLNLGNPAALKGITDLVSHLISESGMTWYRQDFNFYPGVYFASADTPDRIGMTEIRHIEGLYAFWDALRARHPGLKIDNCASGGRRIDLEMISRSFALHRSDCAGVPLGEQVHTQGLAPWVPVNDGIVGGATMDPASSLQIYQTRSGYSAGINFAVEPKNFSVASVVDSVRASLEEFREVRPYWYGDFYSLLPYSLLHDHWTAFQLQRTDRQSGLLIFLRRDASPYASLRVDLHAIDPDAHYEVEVRTNLEKGSIRRMSGKDLARFEVTIVDKPGSALVFYKQQ